MFRSKYGGIFATTYEALTVWQKSSTLRSQDRYQFFAKNGTLGAVQQKLSRTILVQQGTEGLAHFLTTSWHLFLYLMSPKRAFRSSTQQCKAKAVVQPKLIMSFDKSCFAEGHQLPSLKLFT